MDTTQRKARNEVKTQKMRHVESRMSKQKKKSIYTPRTADEDQADVKKTRCANHKLEAAVGRAKWK